MASGKNKKRLTPSRHGLKQDILSQLKRAKSDTSATASPEDERIHDVRRTCKRIRAELRMLRVVAPKRSRRAGNHVRDAAAALSPFRDAQIIPEAFQRVRGLLQDQADRQAYDEVADALARKASPDSHSSPSVGKAVKVAVKHLDLAHRLVAEVSCHDRLLTGESLAPMYERARKSTRVAMHDRSAESFHQLRKQVKAHRYQCRFMQPAYLQEFKDHIKRNRELGDLLGESQDLEVLRLWCKTVSGSADRTALKRLMKGCDELAKRQRQQAIDRACHIFFLSSAEFVQWLDTRRV